LAYKRRYISIYCVHFTGTHSLFEYHPSLLQTLHQHERQREFMKMPS